jgi:mRNA interferase HigB
MHIITRRRIREFIAQHPTSAPSLAAWYKVMSGSEFGSLAELRSVLASADLVAGKTVFNISGNKFRLIAVIHYNRQKVYIRHILTHAEYDRGAWK